jgi:hypothetical protein
MVSLPPPPVASVTAPWLQVPGAPAVIGLPVLLPSAYFMPLTVTAPALPANVTVPQASLLMAS